MKDNNEWYTPREIIESLGVFDLDPASSLEAFALNRSAKQIYTARENGLYQNWQGRIWLNPPYSFPLIREFLKKMADHGNGIALVFSKIESKWFHDTVLNNADAVKFLYERVRFYKPDGALGEQPRNGSMLIAYGEENARILLNAGLKGKFLYLNNIKQEKK